MAIIYRTTDSTRWGTGSSTDLTAAQVDLNFWTLYEQILGITLAVPVGISSFSVSGTSFYVHMTDSSILGPYALPVTAWNYRGAWAPSTVYAPADIVTNANSVYMVLFSHTSGTTFNAGANDGAGHNYYGLLQSAPAGVPAGGTIGQTLAKLSSTDYNTGWTNAGVPLGGSTGQYLAKHTSVDLDTSWVTPPSPIPGGGGINQVLTMLSNTSLNFGWVNAPFTTTNNYANSTLVLSDAWTVIQGQGGTLTVPPNSSVPFPVGTVILIVNSDSGSMTFAPGAGVSFQPQEYTDWVLDDPRGFAVLTKIGTDIWLINGQLRPNINSTAYSGSVNVQFMFIDICKQTPTANTTYNAVNTTNSDGPVLRKKLTFIFTTSGTTSYVITFGTNFISQGTLATGVVSGKRFVVKFQGDGTNYYEVSRTAAM